ncbi:MAG: PAS domain S-box protein [Marinilabiliales bacterium]|nr:PAS domain S-box protein [Marinilabiliales bacterium]
MKPVLKILMVEDSAQDAELIRHQMRKSGIMHEARVTEEADAFKLALAEFQPELILSDFSLPHFSGKDALLLRQELAPDIPFILITGSINEETAVEMMKLGSDDYILKENLTKLGVAIRQVIEKKAIQKEKKAAESKLRILSRAIEQNPASIVITDVRGNIEYVNPRFTELAGYTLQEVQGRNPRVLKSGNKSDGFYKNLWRTILSGKEWRGEFENRNKMGEIYYENTIISPITDENGKITHFLAVKEDITDQKKHQKKYALLAQSLESISECVSITDTEDNIVFVNKSFQRTYGYSEDELMGKSIRMVRPPDIEHLQVREILPRTLEGGWKGEIINKKKDGTLFPVLLSSTTVRDENEKLTALIGVASDITEMIRQREELMEAKARAEENNRLKSALLNNMNHEIRTPMNAIMGFSSLMMDANDQEKVAFANIILNSSNQLLGVIDEMILLSRLQSEKVELVVNALNPSECLRDVFAMFNYGQKEKNLTMKLLIPVELSRLCILSDLTKLKQILTNLLTNAWKFTTSGTIEAGLARIGNQLEFYVRDTGMGIPERERSRIFEAFFRSDYAIAQAIGGSGLGLSISKELVGLLGGELYFTSEEGKGSRFAFTLPIGEGCPGGSTEHETREEMDVMNNFSLLIAEDEHINFRYLEILLKGHLRRIDHAKNGEEAIRMASENHYDMILMDIKMPVMDGIEATKLLKAQFPELRIIAQTAYTLPEETAIIRAAGCDDVLCKPIKKESLLKIFQS